MNAVINTLTEETTTGVENFNLSCLHTVHADIKSAGENIINVQIESALITILLDTGAKSMYQKCYTDCYRFATTQKSSVLLQTYYGKKTPVKDSFCHQMQV